MDAWVAVAGLAVGLLYGVFGVGSAFATPVLSVIGVPGLVAVVTPLPALVPSSLAGAWSYARNDNVDRRLARRVVAVALPAAVAGALASHWIDGRALLVLSGIALFAVGARLALTAAAGDDGATRRREDSRLIVAAAVTIGFASGLLANGGGFLLVPLFLLVLGLDMNRATGTSLVIATALTVPALATHVVLGDIDWPMAAMFAAGLAPGALLGGIVAQRLPTAPLRRAFGFFLLMFATWYLGRQLAGAI